MPWTPNVNIHNGSRPAECQACLPGQSDYFSICVSYGQLSQPTSSVVVASCGLVVLRSSLPPSQVESIQIAESSLQKRIYRSTNASTRCAICSPTFVELCCCGRIPDLALPDVTPFVAVHSVGLSHTATATRSHTKPRPLVVLLRGNVRRFPVFLSWRLLASHACLQLAAMSQTPEATSCSNSAHDGNHLNIRAVCQHWRCCSLAKLPLPTGSCV